ncbi:Uncharacterized protein pbN1_39180 [Aromatoleum bremense]|nr:Uncharacterized protein pbN1_39180 [Aromatoleum bremense]
MCAELVVAERIRAARESATGRGSFGRERRQRGARESSFAGYSRAG